MHADDSEIFISWLLRFTLDLMTQMKLPRPDVSAQKCKQPSSATRQRQRCLYFRSLQGEGVAPCQPMQQGNSSILMTDLSAALRTWTLKLWMKLFINILSCKKPRLPSFQFECYLWHARTLSFHSMFFSFSLINPSRIIKNHVKGLQPSTWIRM